MTNTHARKTSLKWLTVAMPLLETSKIQERERQEIWSYGGWSNIVRQDSWRELEIARNS